METRIFTFGYGQRCPFTGKKLLGYYATVIAPSLEQCTQVMNAMFDGVWAAEYPSVEAAGGEEYGLIEHARIVIPAELKLKPWESSAPLADRIAESMEPIQSDEVPDGRVIGRAPVDEPASDTSS
jgi:hypothetical protein